MSKPNRTTVVSKAFPQPNEIENPAGYGRILLADDDELLRELIAEGLTGNGYRVDCVADGEEAWNLICKEDYDLLITDHNMPQLSGLELLRRLHSSSFDLPAILISGYMPAISSDFNELLSHGAALAKPFSLEQLLMMIQTVLISQSPSPSGQTSRSLKKKAKYRQLT